VYSLHMRKNMWFLTLWACVTSHKMMFSSSINLLANYQILFFFVAEQNSIMYCCLYLLLPVYSMLFPVLPSRLCDWY
jgi:hypothetical protein